MNHEEVCRRRFGPGFPAPCVHSETVECALWECQSRNRCKDSFRPRVESGNVVLAAQKEARAADPRPSEEIVREQRDNWNWGALTWKNH